ncbi:hypothetical protein Peur_071736 [Populus x canadensis]
MVFVFLSFLPYFSCLSFLSLSLFTFFTSKLSQIPLLLLYPLLSVSPYKIKLFH